MKTLTLLFLGVSTLALSLTGCPRDNVGSDYCHGEQVRCSVPKVEGIGGYATPVFEESESEVVEPTWVKDTEAEKMLLVRNGSLWTFSTSVTPEHRMRVRELDGAGNAVATGEIGPPAGSGWQAAFLQRLIVGQDERGAFAAVRWNGEAQEDSIVEILVLGESADAAPQRIVVDGVPRQALLEHVLRDSAGDYLLVYEHRGSFVRKLTAAGATVWQQGAFPWTGEQTASAVLLPNDELMVTFLHGGKIYEPRYLYIGQLDRRGNIVRFAKGALPTSSTDSVSTADGRLFVAATQYEGDLDIFHYDDPESYELDQVVRTGASPLDVWDVARGANGTVYTLTNSGDRESGRPLLCAFRGQAAPSCFILSGATRDKFDVEPPQIQATSDATVYIALGGNTLERVDLPL